MDLDIFVWTVIGQVMVVLSVAVLVELFVMWLKKKAEKQCQHQ